MSALRAAALLAIALAFGVAIADHEDSLTLAVGLCPLIWIALEGVWRLLSGPAPWQAGDSQAESRTGMRREPKGLPNFW